MSQMYASVLIRRVMWGRPLDYLMALVYRRLQTPSSFPNHFKYLGPQYANPF